MTEPQQKKVEMYHIGGYASYGRPCSPKSCSSCGQGAKDGLTFRFLHSAQIERPDPVPQAGNPRFKVALRGRDDLHDRTGKGDLAYPLGAERNPNCLPMDSDLVRHGENTIDFLRTDCIHVGRYSTRVCSLLHRNRGSDSDRLPFPIAARLGRAVRPELQYQV